MIQFLSHAAIVGFMAGAAITIGLQQLKGLLNITDFTTKTDFISVMRSVFKETHEVCENSKIRFLMFCTEMMHQILAIPLWIDDRLESSLAVELAFDRDWARLLCLPSYHQAHRQEETQNVLAFCNRTTHFRNPGNVVLFYLQSGKSRRQNCKFYLFCTMIKTFFLMYCKFQQGQFYMGALGGFVVRCFLSPTLIFANCVGWDYQERNQPCVGTPAALDWITRGSSCEDWFNCRSYCTY